MSKQNGTEDSRSDTSRHPDWLIMNMLMSNAMTSRKDWLNGQGDTRRDIDVECGYVKGQVSTDVYQNLYDRNAIASRVVQVWPGECWQVQPSVYEDDDIEVSTNFEEKWKSLDEQIYDEDNYFQDEIGSPIWDYLCRADILSGIGQYGILLIGIDDDKDLRLPAEMIRKTTSKKTTSAKVTNTETPHKLIYLRALPESLAQVSEFETDITSPRFGHPRKYSITLNDPREQHGGIGLTTGTYEVHWTRVVHIVDNASTNEVFGIPRMRPVLNNLMDLHKLYGGSAEMYWRGALPGWAFETHPTLGGDPIIDSKRAKEQFENWQNGLQRYLLLSGLQSKSLAPQVVDPSQQISVQIDAICVQLGIPKRIFMGSERGELASSQDQKGWNNRVRKRRYTHITPRIIRPFANRLIALGVLPQPKRCRAFWPEVTSQSDQEKAQIALTRTQAMAQYVGAGVENIMTLLDFYTEILGLSEETASAAIEHVTTALEEQRVEDRDTIRDDLEFQVDLQKEGLLVSPTNPNSSTAPVSGKDKKPISTPTTKTTPVAAPSPTTKGV